MRWLWLSAFFAAFFYMHTSPVYTRRPETWMWFIAPAIACAALALRNTEVRRAGAGWLWLTIPLGASLLFVPFPFSVAALLLLLAAALMASAGVSRGLSWAGLSLGLVGAMLALQAAVFLLVYILVSRVHEVPALTPLFYGLARLFHPGAALSEHSLIIHYVYDVFEFPTRLETLGLMPAALFAAAGLVILAALRRSLATMLGFLAFLAGYSVLRYLLLVFLTVRLKTASVFWLELPLALSYLPLALLLLVIPWFSRPAAPAGLALSLPAPRRLLAAAALIAAGVFGVVGLFAYHDAGARKQGRLLIDELHSDWEWTTEEYDTQWYGRRSGYNYYSLAEYLKLHYRVEVEAEPLLPGLLSDFDIVMLKTPTEPLTPEEIEALVDFVRRGGGLWVLGDHTNVFGTSTYLNQLLRHFGLRLRYDSTYDLRTMALSVFERPRVFPHPTVAFMPPFLFATSCSMVSPYFSENMMLGYGLKAMDLDYSQTSFFPRKDSRNYSFGPFVQQGGVKYGRGRVALFTDSTCFSNFFMFIPGKPELVLATVEWLNRANRYDRARWVLLAAGLVSLAAGAAVMRGFGAVEKALIGLAAGFLGFAAAILIYDAHVRSAYPLPTPHTDFVSVAFEEEHSGFNLPTRGLTRFPETSLHTFFVWTQRLGLFPSLEPTLEEALETGDLVVIARPLAPLDDGESASLVEYVNGGGRLLIIVDGKDPRDADVRLLALFGVGLEPAGEPAQGEEKEARARTPGGEQRAPGEPSGAGPAAPRGGESDIEEEGESPEESPERPYIVTLDGKRIVPVAEPVGLEGGKPLLMTSDGRVVLAEVRPGKGRVFVFSDFYLLTSEIMGHTGITPDARQRSISELEYYMLREILDMPQPELYWE